MYNEMIKLVRQETQIDRYGDTKTVPIITEVFAELRSIGQSEFYQAAAVGLRPEVKFVLPDYMDYDGQMIVLYQPYEARNEETYSVIRTYRSGNEIELVCRRGVDA